MAWWAVAATALSLYGQHKSAEAQAEAASDQADANRSLARNIMRNFRYNEKIVREEGRQFQFSQTAAYAKSGVDVGSGSSLLALSDTAAKINQQVEIMEMEAKAQAKATEIGANIADKQAGQIKQAGFFNSLATATRMGGQIYKAST